MSETPVFYPPRRRGLLFHIAAAAALGATCAFAFFYGLNQQVGAYFVLLLLLSLLLFAPLPWLIYNAYVLLRASYRLERDGLRLRWGLRAEDIPLPDVEWVRQASDLAIRLPQPPLSMPGAILGTVNVPDLGVVEYMASTSETLVLIATPQRIYAISPEDPDQFRRAFQQTLEMGSLTPIASVSVMPAAYLSQVWSDRLARGILITGLALTLLLFIMVSLIIPLRNMASLGFQPDGQPVNPGPAAQVMLLPILAAFIYLADTATGLFFYRRYETRTVAYLIWISGVMTGALFLIAASLILLPL